MNKISYSQYSIWANCPLAWKLRYVDDVKFDDSSINTVFGTAMHEVIQEWLEVPIPCRHLLVPSLVCILCS